MSALFGSKVPKPTPPEPAPPPLTTNDDLVAQQTMDGIRRRKGRASTMLAFGQQQQGVTKTLLGS